MGEDSSADRETSEDGTLRAEPHRATVVDILSKTSQKMDKTKSMDLKYTLNVLEGVLEGR